VFYELASRFCFSRRHHGAVMANPSSSGIRFGSFGTAEAHPAEDTASDPATKGTGKMNPAWEFCFRVAERFGIPVVLLVLVLAWVRTDLVQPLLDAHFGFLNKITQAHDAHTEELRNIGSQLDTLIRVADEK
jgi:hypothetical protein